jgi:hypothetical protein
VERTARVLLLIGSATVLVTGCSSAHQPAVEDVVTTFQDPSADPQARCDLLAPATLVTFEEEASTPCEEAIEELPLPGGEVTSVEIWGGDAQVRLAGDTVFLTETSMGWRITAAICRPQTQAPYQCEVDGP